MVANDHMELIPGLPDDVATECLVRVPFTQISKAASVCKHWNIQIEQPNFWQRRRAAGFTQPLLAMAQARANSNQNGGTGISTYQLTICDPQRGFWSELPPIPGLDKGLPMFCQIVGVGRDLVVMGGFQAETWKTLNSIFIYDFLTASWRHGADIPGGQRSFFGCASDSDHTILVAGGHDSSKNALKSPMIYDLANDEWTILPDMARERDECKCIFHRGRFHVIGGYCTDRQGSFGRGAEVLDLGTYQWEQLEDFLPVASCPRNCATDCHDSLYMFLETDHLIERVKDSDKWEMLGAGLPAEEVSNVVGLTAWSGKLFMICKTRSSGCICAYAKDMVNGVLTRIEIPIEYSGHAQSGCYLEI